MQLIDFVDACNMDSKTEMERFELLCYFMAKDEGAESFSPKKMPRLYADAGIAMPDPGELKKDALKGGGFRPYGIEGSLKFAKDKLRSLDRAYGHLWDGSAVKTDVQPEIRVAKVRVADYAAACRMDKKNEMENFMLFCYYLMKERGDTSFSARNMMDLYEDAGLKAPDRASLEKQSKKHDAFQILGVDGTITMKSETIRSLDNKYGSLWDGPGGAQAGAPAPAGVPRDGTNVNSEVLDEAKFCGKKEGFDRLVTQANSSYRVGSYDACAMVMRRLLEVSLIYAFQTNGMESAVMDGDGKYLPLDDIVKKAVDGNVIGTFMRDDLLSAAKIGDYRGRGPMYTFGANEINSVRVAYRNVLDALFAASELL